MEIDLPEVVAEVKQAFERYERALVSNDVAMLDAMFRDDPRTIRYGGNEILYGYDEIKAFGAARAPIGLGRTLSKTVITNAAARARCASGISTSRLTSSAAAMRASAVSASGVRPWRK